MVYLFNFDRWFLILNFFLFCLFLFGFDEGFDQFQITSLLIPNQGLNESTTSKTHLAESLSVTDELDFPEGVSGRRLRVHLRPPHGVLRVERPPRPRGVPRPQVVTLAEPISEKQVHTDSA